MLFEKETVAGSPGHIVVSEHLRLFDHGCQFAETLREFFLDLAVSKDIETLTAAELLHREKTHHQIIESHLRKVVQSFFGTVTDLIYPVIQTKEDVHVGWRIRSQSPGASFAEIAVRMKGPETHQPEEGLLISDDLLDFGDICPGPVDRPH